MRNDVTLPLSHTIPHSHNPREQGNLLVVIYSDASSQHGHEMVHLKPRRSQHVSTRSHLLHCGCIVSIRIGLYRFVSCVSRLRVSALVGKAQPNTELVGAAGGTRIWWQRSSCKPIPRQILKLSKVFVSFLYHSIHFVFDVHNKKKVLKFYTLKVCFKGVSHVKT